MVDNIRIDIGNYTVNIVLLYSDLEKKTLTQATIMHLPDNLHGLNDCGSGW